MAAKIAVLTLCISSTSTGIASHGENFLKDAGKAATQNVLDNALKTIIAETISKSLAGAGVSGAIAGPIINIAFATMFGGGSQNLSADDIWNMIKSRVFNAIDLKIEDRLIEEDKLNLYTFRSQMIDMETQISELDKFTGEAKQNRLRSIYDKLSGIADDIERVVEKNKKLSNIEYLLDKEHYAEANGQVFKWVHARPRLRIMQLFATMHLAALNAKLTLASIVDPISYDKDLKKYNLTVFDYKEHVAKNAELLNYWRYKVYDTYIINNGHYLFSLSLRYNLDKSYSENDARGICQQKYNEIMFPRYDDFANFTYGHIDARDYNKNRNEPDDYYLYGRNGVNGDEYVANCVKMATVVNNKFWDLALQDVETNNIKSELLEVANSWSYISDYRYSTDPVYSFKKGNMCLHAMGKNNGDPLRLRSCNPSSRNQMFLYDSEKQALHSLIDTNKCVDISRKENDAPIYLYDCHFRENQQFSFSPFPSKPGYVWIKSAQKVRGKPLALDRKDLGMTADTEIIAFSQNRGEAQDWMLEVKNIHQPELYTFEFKGNCLHIDEAKSGSNVYIKGCDDSLNQRWVYQNNSLRPVLNPSYCVDISGFGRANRTNIFLFNCHEFTNQKWDIRSRYKGGVSIVSHHLNEDGKEMALNRIGGGPNVATWLHEEGKINEKWNLKHYKQYSFIKNIDTNGNETGQCLGVDSTNVTTGSNVIKTQCNANLLNQQWIYLGNTLRPAINNGLCVEGSEDGTSAYLKSCVQNEAGQQITFTGEEFFVGNKNYTLLEVNNISFFWKFSRANQIHIAKKYDHPECYWNSLEWNEMDSLSQTLWKVLGWNSSNWGSGISYISERFWGEPDTVGHTNEDWSMENNLTFLNNYQRSAAVNLGYTKNLWDTSQQYECHMQ
ncbi:ricin-type beta-trefoil lectin domain protein [Zooshikella harenae]|uniref:Ricin-type beta-trefoil lectin domain protein n=1 Tax=Zooshikella harenae TaxID=2827238 RepID=A0ABS5ZIK7_9GAMM|nr:ricin-type beta-trefoil lectin domain protein [Zooshikella harenae]MBU2713613.1 ricin-type beta-trefoil lectin domain protein [Zooshikella harenae]